MTNQFTYTYGGIEFTFVPYKGWQEDVRVAAVFLLGQRPYAATATRLRGAFSPPAQCCRGGGCCGPGSWCCSRAEPHKHCAACGSSDIHYDPADGWSCNACHRTDADE